MSKHTPGPWRMYDGTVWSEYKELDLKDRTNRISISSPQLRMPDDERLANARLIAAAPELLQAAKNLEAELARLGYGSKGTDLDDLTVNLALMIAKAEGKE